VGMEIAWGRTLKVAYQAYSSFWGWLPMVWGCMGWDGVDFLTKLDVNMTKDIYAEVLKDELMETLEYYGKEVRNITFQHDNAPSH
jgi:hypothetical protein